MLLYGGIGLLAAGVITMFFADKLTKDAAKAEQMKKQAPYIAIVGGVMLIARMIIA